MKNELTIIKRVNLSKGQKVLYSIICKKLEQDKPLVMEEAVEMWLNNVCKTFNNGIPCYWNWYHHKDEKDEWRGGLTPLTQYEIKLRSLSWLMMSIGSLVLKGYLKIIPKLQLSNNQ